MIRHSKNQRLQGEAVVELPPRTIETRTLSWASPHERFLYEYLEDAAQAQFRQAEATGQVQARVIQLGALVRELGLACSHPTNVRLHVLDSRLRRQASLGASAKAATAKQILDNLAEFVGVPRHQYNATSLADLQGVRVGKMPMCSICLDSCRKPVLSACMHIFCGECLNSHIASNGTQGPFTRKANCPECRHALSVSDMTEVLPEAVLAQGGDGTQAFLQIAVPTPQEVMSLYDEESSIESIGTACILPDQAVAGSLCCKSGERCLCSRDGLAGILWVDSDTNRGRARKVAGVWEEINGHTCRLPAGRYVHGGTCQRCLQMVNSFCDTLARRARRIEGLAPFADWVAVGTQDDDGEDSEALQSARQVIPLAVCVCRRHCHRVRAPLRWRVHCSRC